MIIFSTRLDLDVVPDVNNNILKSFAEYLGISSKEYNKFKAGGTAHDFQKVICAREYDKIKWNMIPGRALNLLVNLIYTVI